MKLLSPWQSRRLHQLLNSTKKMDVKADLVSYYTHGRSTSSKDMTYLEVNTLIRHLESFQASDKPAYKPVSDSSDRMRKKIIAMAYDLKWQHVGGKIDMDHINDWCIKSGMFHKELNAHTDAELSQLVTQFEKVRTSFLKALANGK
jgi:hypothetical protein